MLMTYHPNNRIVLLQSVSKKYQCYLLLRQGERALLVVCSGIFCSISIGIFCCGSGALAPISIGISRFPCIFCSISIGILCPLWQGSCGIDFHRYLLHWQGGRALLLWYLLFNFVSFAPAGGQGTARPVSFALVSFARFPLVSFALAGGESTALASTSIGIFCCGRERALLWLVFYALVSFA